MKILAFCLSLLLLASPYAPSLAEAPVWQEEIIPITAHDGVVFDGKLRLPSDGTVDKLVIYVNGSGPNTYDNERMLGDMTFRYFDLFAQELTRRGIAFFSYNTRGVTPGKDAPLFADIDEAVYETYTPSNEVQDIVSIVQTLTARPDLADVKVSLLGWSAGTIIAPQVVLTGAVDIDALLLGGYANDTMEEILTWQQTGGSSMVFYRQYFDFDQSGDITPEELEEDPYGVAAQIGVDFETLDVNGDGLITGADFDEMLRENREAVFAAFENGDDAWLKENYPVQLTSAWYQDYHNFPPNREVLPALDLPVYIFHGQYDGNVSVEGVYAIEAAFEAAGKDNLTAFVLEGADHDLNYFAYPLQGEIPEGFTAIFDVLESR